MSGFDRLAPVYDLFAGLAFGPALLRAQRWAVTHGLSTATRRILFVGGGTGLVLPEVLARCPDARVVYVEPSAAMLARARRRMRRRCPADAARVVFHQGTLDTLPPEESVFDAVLTFFVLDLFPEPVLAALLGSIGERTVAPARWLVADFAPPQNAWQRALLRMLYTFFGITTGLQTRHLPDWPTALGRMGLRPVADARSLGGSLRAGVWVATD